MLGTPAYPTMVNPSSVHSPLCASRAIELSGHFAKLADVGGGFFVTWCSGPLSCPCVTTYVIVAMARVPANNITRLVSIIILMD